jgi:uracil permease
VALGGFIMCGILFCLVSFIVKKAGTGWLDVMFPPAAMGAIVAVIGLELAGVAAVWRDCCLRKDKRQTQQPSSSQW